jgi:hypothetical protein
MRCSAKDIGCGKRCSVFAERWNITNCKPRGTHNPRTEIREGYSTAPSSAKLSRDAATIRRAKPCAGLAPGLRDCAPAKLRNNLRHTSRGTTRECCRRCCKGQTHWEHNGQPPPALSTSALGNREEIGEARLPTGNFSAQCRRGRRAPTPPRLEDGRGGWFAPPASNNSAPHRTMKLPRPAAADD